MPSLYYGIHTIYTNFCLKAIFVYTTSFHLLILLCFEQSISIFISHAKLKKSFSISLTKLVTLKGNIDYVHVEERYGED